MQTYNTREKEKFKYSNHQKKKKNYSQLEKQNQRIPFLSIIIIIRENELHEKKKEEKNIYSNIQIDETRTII